MPRLRIRKLPIKTPFLKILTAVLFLGLILVLLNLRVSSRQGINYVSRKITMPLYIKAIEFIDRDYHYRTLAKAITVNCKNPEDKVIALFNWSMQNIRKNQPGNLPVIDDHVLNIIIRGYGTADQIADVFTTLCNYSGFRAVMYMLSPDNPASHICIAAVYLKGQWRLLDTFHGVYPVNREGKIASLSELRNKTGISINPSLGQEGDIYLSFYSKVVPIGEVNTTKAELQMPLKRLIYEIKRGLHLTKRAKLFYGQWHNLD